MTGLDRGDPCRIVPSIFQSFERLDQQGGDLVLSEYTDDWTEEAFAEFDALDTNGDGFVTQEELGASAAMTGGTFGNFDGMMLPPNKTVVSEITVTDDFLIRDLNVELSLTHSYVSQLDIFLIGPDGREIELCTACGGSDDNFDRTLFDDQGKIPINRARGPFTGSHIPEALLKRQPSLNSYAGKSVKGVWQLSFRGARNERFGMLHNWSLHVKPMEKGSDGGDQPTEGDAADESSTSDNGDSSERRRDGYRRDSRRDGDRK